MDQIFKGVENLLRAAAQIPVVSSFQDPDCTDYLARLEQINASAGLLAAVDGQGAVRCGEARTGTSLADQDHFHQALRTDELVIGTYRAGSGSEAPVLPVALRIQTSEGPGAIVAGVKLAWLRQHLAGLFAEFPPDSSLTILDQNGIILVRFPNRDREGKQLTRYPELLTARRPSTFRSTAEKNADGIARFLGISPLEAPPRGLVVAAGYPQEAALAEIRASAMRNYLWLGLAALFAFFAAAAGGRIFIRQPLNELLATMERWRSQDMTARVKHASGSSEFDQLGKSFNSMANELEAALKHKDVLLRELSHRVMNSLNTIGALFRLQLKSVQAPSAVEHFSQAISRIDAIALKRMQAAQGVEAVEFASFLAELCKDLHSSMMGTKMPCVVEAEPVSLSPNQAIPLSLIVNELLTNAIKHGADDHQPIQVRLESSPEHCRLAVRNRGALPDGYDVGQASGFGLKMVSSMVSQLHGTLEASSADGETEFAVSFRPAVPQATVYGSGERMIDAGGTPGAAPHGALDPH